MFLHIRTRHTIALVLLGAAVYAASIINVPYRIKARAMFLPAHEYTLVRTNEGNLVSSFKDNIRNVIRTHGVTQFQRGDVVEFVLSDRIADRAFVRKGDLLGRIYSDEQQRQLRELNSQMEVLQAQLVYHTTGQKPEDVQQAREQWALAKQELETQKKLTERSRLLAGDSLVSQQEYEIEANKLRVQEIGVNIARARYLSITSGEKREQAELISAQIEAVRGQIEQLTHRIGYFTLRSPASGMVVLKRDRDPADPESVLSVADTSTCVAVIPIQLKERGYLRPGQHVYDDDRRGTLSSVGNSITIIANRQAFYATAVWPWTPEILPGAMREVVVQCEPITVIEYLARVLAPGDST